MKSANKVKAANDRLAAEWKKEGVIHEYNTLDEKLSNEGAEYNQNKKLNGKTFKEIAEELKKESTINNDDAPKVDLAGDSASNEAVE
jgi:predicted nucleotide-binding protein (sugar kinase/HSP70/actin superfamily)